MIETARLITRPWTNDDAPRIAEILNTYDVAKYLTTAFPFKLKDAIDYINRPPISPDGKVRIMSYAIELKDGGGVVGGMTIPVNVNDESIIEDGGIWLDTAYQGKGYGAEIFHARAKYCFDVLGAEKINSGFFEGNEASWSMMKKVGFKLTGKREEFNCPAIGKKVFNLETVLHKGDFVK